MSALQLLFLKKKKQNQTQQTQEKANKPNVYWFSGKPNPIPTRFGWKFDQWSVLVVSIWGCGHIPAPISHMAPSPSPPGGIFAHTYAKVITGRSLGDLFGNNAVMSLRIICCPETGIFPCRDGSHKLDSHIQLFPAS